MDFGATISRAFRIMWDHKVLWILGFLAALGGGAGTNFQGSSYRYNNTPGNLSPFSNLSQQDLGLILAGASLFFCLMLILGLVLFVVGLIARGGLIAGVQQVETEGNTTFGRAWAVGADRFWRLLGLNILLWLPMIIVIVILVILFGGAIAGMIASGTNMGRGNLDNGALMGLLSGGVIVLCCLLCLVVIYALIAMALQTFGERAIVLENLGVTESIGRAWSIFRSNLGNIILLAIVMMVISWAVGLIALAAASIVIAPTMLPLIYGLSQNAVVSAGTTVLAVVGVIVGIIISALISTLYITFNSAAWTLAFRSFTGAAPAQPDVVPPLPAA
jgi:hypothetical protein